MQAFAQDVTDQVTDLDGEATQDTNDNNPQDEVENNNE